MQIILCSIFILLLLPGCRSGAGNSGGDGVVIGPGLKLVDSASLRQGIIGEVRVRPTKPIEDEGEAAWAPLPDATILVEDAGNNTLGRIKSDRNGRFSIEVASGTHYLKPQKIPGKMFPHPLPGERVYVPEGGVVSVVLNYDTGIR